MTSQYFKHLLDSLAVFLLFWMLPKYLHTHLTHPHCVNCGRPTPLSVIWVMITCLPRLAAFSPSILAPESYDKVFCILLTSSSGSCCGRNILILAPSKAIRWPFLPWFCHAYRDLLLGEVQSSGQPGPSLCLGC